MITVGTKVAVMPGGDYPGRALEGRTMTITTCGEGNHYDKYVSFCATITKKMFGSTSKAKKILNRYIKEDK